MTISVLLVAAAAAAGAQPPPDRLQALQRGVSITNWFRFPGNADPAMLRSYLSDIAIADLHRVGFTFVRLPVQPDFLQADPNRQVLLVEAIRRLEKSGLAVVVDAHPTAWHLETNPSDQVALRAFWRSLAPALRSLDPGLTFPELLNEPVFPHGADQWQVLQEALLHIVRRDLPRHTIVLTGNDWSSTGGLLALRPGADGNVVYAFHFYEPPELTSLAAYRPGLDRAALARLPFPATQPVCDPLAAAADPETAGVIRYYCALHWDAARVAERLGEMAAWARSNHAAVLLGEFGASAALHPAARQAWLAAVRQAAEANGIGWTLWGYEDVMGFAIARPPRQRPVLDATVLRALGLRDGR